jgi:hypothetical protein
VASVSHPDSDRLLMGSPLRRSRVCRVICAVLLVVLVFATLVHLTLLASRSRCTKAATEARWFAGVPELRYPMVGSLACCARYRWPARRRAAEKRYELAPPHDCFRGPIRRSG